MNHAEKVARIKSMLTQVAPHHDLEALPAASPADGELNETAPPQTRRSWAKAQVGVAEAASGVKKLKENRDSEISPSELMGLEAIVLLENRPVAFVRHGSYDRMHAPWDWLDGGEIRARVNPLLGSIGRIELPNMQSVPYGGTGFLVGPGLLMTNRHVARLFADGVGAATRLRYYPGDAAVDFKREAFAATDNSSYFTISDVLMIHPYWDMALVRVEGLPAALTPLTLSTLSPEELVDRDVIVVGYPARDVRNDAAAQDAIFEGIYNVKRLQPGKIRPRSRVRSFGYEVDAIVHDSSTLGGNSGSAVIDIQSGHVIGLHFAGEYLKANYAVPSYELARDARVVDAGVAFNAFIGATEQWQHAWRSVDDEHPAKQRPPAVHQASPTTAVLHADGARGPVTSLEIPLTVHISIDGIAPAMTVSNAHESTRRDGRISMRQLQEMMRDPAIDEAELKRYFITAPAASKPFAPAVMPNPELVDVAPPGDTMEGAMMMSWANGLSRLRRQARFKGRRAAGDPRPVLVSEGDSWFQFPVMLEDVIDNLQGDFNVWSVDSAGDTLQNMVLDNAEYLKAIRMNADSVAAFLFSGGGNDIVGEDASGKPVLPQILRRYESGRPAEWYLDNEALARRLDFIEQCYHAVIANVAREFPRLPIICHGYDYAIPGGGPDDLRKPMWAANDKWIGKPLRDSLGITDARLQRDIVALLIDRLNDTVHGLCGGSNPAGTFRNAWHVDLRRSVNGRWADELHPTNEGFAAVTESFKAMLRRALQQSVELWGGEAAHPAAGRPEPAFTGEHASHHGMIRPVSVPYSYPGQHVRH